MNFLNYFLASPLEDDSKKFRSNFQSPWTSLWNLPKWMEMHFSRDGKIWACKFTNRINIITLTAQSILINLYINWHWILTRVYFRPNQESQKIFKAAQPMDATQVKTKLIGYGFSLLEGVDPNPEVKIQFISIRSNSC